MIAQMNFKKKNYVWDFMYIQFYSKTILYWNKIWSNQIQEIVETKSHTKGKDTKFSAFIIEIIRSLW